MFSAKYLTVAVHMILIITWKTEGYNYGSSSHVLSRMEPVSESEINSVYVSTSERERLRLSVDQVYSERPQEVPSCLYERHVYDPTAQVCGQPGMRAHCGQGMTFLPVPNSQDLGACACTRDTGGCWGRPQFLNEYNQCYFIATQGPCSQGETLNPISKFDAECGPDVCHYMKPENAINFSELSIQAPLIYHVFNFTYLGKCFTTESQAFCPRGRVVRFVVPFKIPVCVDPKNVTCLPIIVPQSVQVARLRSCGPGLEANPSRGICQRISALDFGK